MWSAFYAVIYILCPKIIFMKLLCLIVIHVVYVLWWVETCTTFKRSLHIPI